MVRANCTLLYHLPIYTEAFGILKEERNKLETQLQTSKEEADGLREQLKAYNEQNSEVDDLQEQLKASNEQKGLVEKELAELKGVIKKYSA